MLYSMEEYVLWNLIYSNAKKEKLNFSNIIYIFRKSIEQNINLFLEYEKINWDEKEFNILSQLNVLDYFENKYYAKYEPEISKIIKKCKKDNINMLFFEDENYPQKLKNISTPPIMIYYKGKFPTENEKILTIAGSREISGYGKIIVDRVVKLFAIKNYSILSGLASGIDSQAHTSALDNYVTTFAILGQGLGTQVYPKENKELSMKIIQSKGCLISEIEPYKHPNRDYFLLRNRLQAALADKIFIGEIKETGGGTLTTIEYSIAYKKEIYIWNPVNLYIQGKIYKSFLGNLILFENYDTNKNNKILKYRNIVKKNAIEIKSERDFENKSKNFDNEQMKLF